MIRRLLARLRCQLSDHIHETVAKRHDEYGALVVWTYNRCRRCDWVSR
jgi:hypothetical protein